MASKTSTRFVLRFIVIVSILIPLAVALLLFLPERLPVGNQGWVRSLPAFNAVINSLTALALILAVVAVKRKNIALHRALMTFSLFLGTLFLISYVTYHATVPSTVFGDINHNGVLDASERDALGSVRGVYLGILLSHIGLSIVVVPFVLMAFFFALTGQIGKHRKVVKFTFPIWLYVSVTGVIVYFMISPYYF